MLYPVVEFKVVDGLSNASSSACASIHLLEHPAVFVSSWLPQCPVPAAHLVLRHSAVLLAVSMRFLDISLTVLIILSLALC